MSIEPFDSIINYYFEVFDNDEVSGKKSARTALYDFVIPSQEELEKMQEQYSKEIQSSFEQSTSIAQELMRDFDKLKQKLLSENISDWERKQVLEEMQEKQEQMKQQIENLTQSLEQKNDMQNKLSEQDEELEQVSGGKDQEKGIYPTPKGDVRGNLGDEEPDDLK